MNNNMYFKKLSLSEWQQFDNINIEFHSRLTVLTGANGSGKTTILNLLAKHCGWNIASLGTPVKDKESGVFKILTRFFRGKDKSDNSDIGSITYSNSISAILQIPNASKLNYNINIANQQEVKCVYIPSHRSVYRYAHLDNIPTVKKDKKTAFAEVSQNIRERYFGGGNQSSSYFMKSTLIGWVIQGYGVKSNTKSIMPPDEEQVQYFEGFQKVLEQLLPSSLGFKDIEIRNMEVVFICNDGNDEFILETASGGISTLIDMAW